MVPSGVLFDLDGTLTQPVLDFRAIRDEMALPGHVGVWEGMQAKIAADPSSREHLEEVLFRHERRAAETAPENPGAAALMRTLAARGLKVGVVTRNARSHAELALARLRLDVGCLVAREDAVPKPDPAPVLLACQRLQLDPTRAWFVGDYVHDTQAGAAAGCLATVLITNGLAPRFAYEATHTITRLPELHALLGLGD